MPTTVSGFLKLTSTSADTSNVKLRFTLRGFTPFGANGQQPLVPGVGVLAATDLNGNYYVDFVPDGTGAVSGTLYSTRDASGTGDGDIEVGTSKQAVWYDMGLIISGNNLPTIPIHAKNGVTLDPSSVTPITTPTVVAAPTGDTTYARLDGANQPFTSAITAPKLNKVTITAPATGSTLTVADGKTLTANNTLTLAGTDGKTLTLSNNLTLAGTDGTTLTFQGTDTYVGRATTDTLTNKTLVGSSNPAASGIVRLAAADTIAFRNTGNSADIALSKNGYDQITATGLSNRILQNFTSTALTGAGGLSFQSAASKTIKANSLGAHGALLIRLAGSGVTASGGTANITVQFGGTNKTVLSVPQSTTYTFRLEALLCNQNQTGQQLITWTSQYNSTLATQSNNTYTIDTTADQTLSLGVVFSNASDNITFQNMLVELMPASAAI